MEMQDLIIPVIIKKDNKTGEIDLNQLHAPIPTKYAILLARDFYERNKDIRNHVEDLNR